MAKRTTKSKREYPETIQNLLDDQSGRYKHLQIIMGRKNYSAFGLGQEYLVVNRIGFGIYKLDNIDYCDDDILMTITNTENGKTGGIRLNINNEHPEHFLICWNDIKRMVHTNSNCLIQDDNLLELEND